MDLNAQRSASARAKFQQRKDEAKGIAAKHDKVNQDYVKDLWQAEQDSKKIQLENFLDSHLIRNAKLKGITSDRVLSLESFGIESAKDVPMLKSQKVPGIGPVISNRLLDWRDDLIKTFVPSQKLPESEKNRVASRYAPVMLPLGQAIQGAIQDLEGITTTHRSREAELVRSIATAVQASAVAQAHVDAMRISA